MSILLLASWSLAALAKPIPVDGFIANVNGHVITMGDVMKLILPANRKAQTELKGADLDRQLRKNFQLGLDRLIERYLIISEFDDDDKLTIPPQMIDDRINEIINTQFQDNHAAFMSALEKDGLTQDEWRSQIRENLIMSMYRREKVSKQVSVSPIEVRRLYESRKEQYKSPERVNIQVIVIKEGETSEEKAEKLTQAYALRRLLVKGGNFDALAATHSEGFNAESGGRIDWMESSALRPDIREALSAVEVGGITEVVRVNNEYWIVKLLDREEQGFKAYKDLQQQLENELRVNQEQAIYEAWIVRLRNKYPVKRF